jgi:hypothetical protein
VAKIYLMAFNACFFVPLTVQVIAVAYAKSYSGLIPVYDATGHAIETDEHTGEFKESAGGRA